MKTLRFAEVIGVEKKIVTAPGAPAPIGPYSPGLWLRAGFSLSLARYRLTRKRDNVVKVVVYLKGMGKYSEFNEVHSEFFGESKPTRAVVEVSNLLKGVDIEVEAIAVL